MTYRRRLAVTTVFGSAVLGGAERWLLQLLDATDRLHVTALLLSGGPLEDELAIRDIPFATIGTGSRPTEMARSAWAVARELERTAPDVILANGGKAPAVALPAGALSKTRVVWAKHDFARDGGIARVFAKLSDSVVATSRELLDSVGARGTVIAPPRPAYPPEGQEQARAFWDRAGVDLSSAPVAAMVGRLDPHKGHEAAIAALSHVDPEWRLVVVGEDDPTAPGTRRHLEAVAARRGVADRVRFTGSVSDAGRHLAAFDAVLCLPEHGHRPRWGSPTSARGQDRGRPLEGFGIVAMEALLAGVPVVATAGIPALALMSDAVVAVDAPDPRAVADALGAVVHRGASVRSDPVALWKSLPDAERQADLLASVLAATAARAGAGVTSRPPVSVISTVLNEGDSIRRLLATLAEQGGPDDEFVIVDGGSRDETPAIVAEAARTDERVRFVSAPGVNIAEGRNVAVRHCRHEIVVSTDGGCEQEPGWLDAMAAPFAELEPPGLALGMYLPVSDSPMDAAMTVAHYPVPAEAGHPSVLSRLYCALFGLRYDPTLPTGRTMAFRVEAWDAAGGYPGGLYAAEDVTFGRAVDAAGYRCALATDARVHWHHRSDMAATAKMFYVYGVGDGRSGNRLLIARDVVRASAYLAAPILFRRGGMATKAAVALAGMAYVSLPVVRTKGMRDRLGVLARIPAAMAVKDLPKVAGCAVGLWARFRGDDTLATGGRFADRPSVT